MLVGTCVSGGGGRWWAVNLTLEITLKEQYPVTVHEPNLDFLTGCRKFKRCEESKGTLKNPFASSLAEFDTTAVH